VASHQASASSVTTKAVRKAKNTTPPIKASSLDMRKDREAQPASKVTASSAKQNVQTQADKTMSSPPMRSRDPDSPPFYEQMADEVVSNSESEAYSPSRMPQYSPSPVPEEDMLELPTARISPARQENLATQTKSTSEDASHISDKASIVEQPEAGLNPPPMPMTQVASSQSPEESQLLRSGSEIGLHFDEETDMLASDGEDNALADDLLKDTLADLPDLPTVVATDHSVIAAITTHEEMTTVDDLETSTVHLERTVASSIIEEHVVTSRSSSTQQSFMDPMDLSQAFRDEEDEEDEMESDEPGQSSRVDSKSNILPILCEESLHKKNLFDM